MKEIHNILKAIFRDYVKILKHVHTVMYKLCSEVKMILNQISKQNHFCFDHINILQCISLVQSGIYFTHRVQLVKLCLAILKDFSWSNVSVISDHAKIFFSGKTYFPLAILSYALKVKHFYMSFTRDFLYEFNIV